MATTQARKADQLAREVLAQLKPPSIENLSIWIPKHIRLWDGPQVNQPFRLWPQQREIADAIGDPDIPRVSVQKSVRGGYTKTLIAGIGAKALNNPCDMILLVPTDDDARGFAVDEVEPCFDGSRDLKGLLTTGKLDGRNTLTIKNFPGGSLKILSARSPRNLRRHDAKDLYVDEEDGMEITTEGDPLLLAERRTLAHADRKIVRGSTPTIEGLSTIAKAYAESDQRVFEVPCPFCHAFFEILWKHIAWPKGDPDKAVCICPHCETPIEERYKTEMVFAGGEQGWHRRRPDVVGHAGFRFNAFISFFANARWSVCAAEFERAVRQGPAELQVFRNTLEGLPWKQSLDSVDESTLLERVEDFGIKPDPNDKARNRFPAEVLALVAGVDTQDDRFEVALWGLNETEAFFVDHHVIWGDPADSTTQAELDAYLKTTWQHPNGWQIGIEGAAVDSQGHKTQAVYDFCRPRLARRIYAIISRVGSRRTWEPSKSKKAGEVRLMIVGHDQIKTLFMQRLAIPPIDEKTGQPNAQRFRYSSDLEPETFDQLTGEKRVIRYQRGNKALIEFKPKKPGQRVEALDASCYALAFAHSLRINWAERRARKLISDAPRKSLGDLSALLNR